MSAGHFEPGRWMARCAAFALLMLLGTPAAFAQVFGIDGGFALGAEDTSPLVRFQTGQSRAQALWAQRGSIVAVGLEGARRSPSRSILMPGMASCEDIARCVRYSAPDLAAVPGGDRWLVAASLQYTVDRGFDHVGGAGFPLILHYPMLEVAAMDGDRRRLWRLTLDPAGSNPFIGPQRPAIAATREGALLAYTDMRPGGGLERRLFVQRLSLDGSTLGAPTALPTLAARWADNARVVAGEREYLVVYETDQDLRAQRIDAASGSLLRSELIAAKTRAESHPSGRPVVAWSAKQRRYVVSWREGARIRLLFLSDSARPLHAPLELPPPCSGFGCLFSSQVEGWPSLSISPAGDRVNVAYSARPLLDTSRLGQVAYSLPVATPLAAAPSSRWLVAPTDGPAEESSHAVSTRGPTYAVFRRGERLFAKLHAD